jgi:hypothetical protein
MITRAACAQFQDCLRSEPRGTVASFSLIYAKGGVTFGRRAITDLRDFDRRIETNRRLNPNSGADTPTPWGWIASAVLIVAVLALVLTSGNYERTASNNLGSPAPRATAPALAPITPPAQTPSTTGQGR